jgi:hypothetical protein
MKKTLILLLLFNFLSLTVAYSQEYAPPAVMKRILKYFEATEKKDWPTVVDMIYPKFFEMVPRENMLEVFESMESEGLSMRMKNFGVRTISSVVPHDQELFVLINYDMEINIGFTSVEYRDEAVQLQIRKNFESIYGRENVSYYPASFSFDIKASRSMFGVSNRQDGEWYFIENDNNEIETNENWLIPPKVRSKLSSNAPQN